MLFGQARLATGSRNNQKRCLLFKLYAELVNSFLVSLKIFTVDTLLGGRWWKLLGAPTSRHKVPTFFLHSIFL